MGAGIELVWLVTCHWWWNVPKVSRGAWEGKGEREMLGPFQVS